MLDYEQVHKYLLFFIESYGYWVYIILFLCVFLKTGVLFLSFLPGETLLILSGVMIRLGILHIEVSVFSFIIASILGGMTNYMAGYYIGNRLISPKYKKAIQKTRLSYHKYGSKLLIVSRFIPLLRNFAPLVAGMCKVHYISFIIYNIIGGVAWVISYLFIGYFFGNIFN